MKKRLKKNKISAYFNPRRGSQTPSGKFTEKEITNILLQFPPTISKKERGLKILALAKLYNVNRGTIAKIVTRVTWTHVPNPHKAS